MQLSFLTEDRHFYLYGVGLARAAALGDSRWCRIDPRTLCTADLSAAARFRPFADDTCERVFTRAFNCELEAPPLPPLSFLDPHQIAGVRHILTRKRSYLAHAPGAGKTAQAIIASCMIKEKGVAVYIVPPGLTLNWEREIEKFATRFCAFPRVSVVRAGIDERAVGWRSDFLIIPDSMLAKPWVYSRLKKLKIKLLAVDEASRFKETTSLRSKALFGGRAGNKTYSGLYQDASRVVLLDGSPMPNRPMELWAPIYALDPEAIDCMQVNDFGFRFCGASLNERGSWEFKASSNEKELRERLRRRLFHFVGEEELSHPERRRSMLFMNRDTRTAVMRAWEREHLKLLKTTEISEDLSQGEIATHRKDLGISKIAWVAGYIIERLKAAPEEKILLFAWHREVCTGLHRLLEKHQPGCSGLVMGGTPNDERERMFEEFQKPEATRLRVITGNIAAMGRGYNLQRAGRVVFAEPSWSDELNRQCEKRASRRGRDQEAFVRCEYIVLPDSLDERVMTSLFSKQQRVKRIIG